MWRWIVLFLIVPAVEGVAWFLFPSAAKIALSIPLSLFAYPGRWVEMGVWNGLFG